MERKFPNYFKIYRKKHGLAQKQMAQLLGKDRFYVAKLENGERKASFQTVIAYSLLFGVKVSDLMPEFCQHLCKLLENRINEQPHLFKDENALKLIRNRLNCDEEAVNPNCSNNEK